MFHREVLHKVRGGDSFLYGFDPVTLRVYAVESGEGSSHRSMLETILAEAGGKMLKAELAKKLQARTGLSKSRSYKIIGEATSTRSPSSEIEDGKEMVRLNR